jgi:hypothetical protein
MRAKAGVQPLPYRSRGTAVAPRPGDCPRTGVAGVSVQTVPQAYLLPLAGWRRMMLARMSRDARVVAGPESEFARE